MSAVDLGLRVQVLLTAVALLAALLPVRARRLLSGVCAVLLGAAIAATGVAVLAGGTGRLSVATALPLDPLLFAPSGLGAYVMVLVGVVGAIGAIAGTGSAHGASSSSTTWAAYALFLLGMSAVCAADDVVGFLFGWELMALASTVLVLTEHRERADVRSAGLLYAVMTHLSFLLVLLGFSILAAQAGSTSFAALSRVDPSSGAASVAYVLLVLGFLTKAGAVPLHVWLPRAHPAAPTHVSAVMSAAMVKLGVYGVLLVVLRLLPGGPWWWGLLLVLVGVASATYGILRASVLADLKVSLACSTTENVGLMVTAVGVAVLLRGSGESASAQVAVAACLLLMVAHAAFKTTLFLGAGAVLHATGVRDADELGGLAARMPVTSASFGVGALGAAALPVTAGFVAEWALFQSLVHGGDVDDRLVSVVLPVTVALVALTAGLALLTFVKMWGLAFLARPRSAAAAAAREVGGWERTAGLLGACAVVAIGVAPGLLAPALRAAGGLTGVEPVGVGGISFPGIGVSLQPAVLAIVAVVLSVLLAVPVVLAARRTPRRRVELPWGCGGVRLDPRMQYTATSYAEPLTRVFDDALRPRRELEVVPYATAPQLVSEVHFRQDLDDVVETRAYRPVVRLADRIGAAARSLQDGSIHRYLLYAFAALVVVLVVVAL